MATRLEMVLSVFHDPQGRSSHSKSGKDKENFIVHLVIQSTPKGKFYIDNGKTFNSVDELVRHFTENNVAVRNLNVRLIKGVTLAPWEIQGKHVRIGDLMGGPGPVEVHRCFVKIDGSDREAAGTLISGQSPHAWQTLKELARQCRLLRELKHPCVIQFYGVCTLARPCCFLLEYVSEGKLNLYLIKNRGNLKREELLQMTISAGWGLDYLHTKGILHRDITARNCFYNKQLVSITLIIRLARMYVVF
ncbi:hypothetical protein ANCCAN_28902 [Ancylostoma caninum]|uniref:Protein kinase domain-containing protein n=1 Tax=Ancylostoma caninum TaxID=29170 RepID=A0A368F5B4_ANCCA|nr:hypothetical protein ANCCAN_28902 [Ancylostoma caninum]